MPFLPYVSIVNKKTFDGTIKRSKFCVHLVNLFEDTEYQNMGSSVGTVYGPCHLGLCYHTAMWWDRWYVFTFVLCYLVATLSLTNIFACHIKLIILLMTELRALAELIGPYGMKYLSEGLMRQISCQVDELKVKLLFFLRTFDIFDGGRYSCASKDYVCSYGWVAFVSQHEFVMFSPLSNFPSIKLSVQKTVCRVCLCKRQFSQSVQKFAVP
jgi:Membrane-associated apoptosis protein